MRSHEESDQFLEWHTDSVFVVTKSRGVAEKWCGRESAQSEIMSAWSGPRRRAHWEGGRTGRRGSRDSDIAAIALRHRHGLTPQADYGFDGAPSQLSIWSTASSTVIGVGWMAGLVAMRTNVSNATQAHGLSGSNRS